VRLACVCFLSWHRPRANRVAHETTSVLKQDKKHGSVRVWRTNVQNASLVACDKTPPSVRTWLTEQRWSSTTGYISAIAVAANRDSFARQGGLRLPSSPKKMALMARVCFIR
ncbi:unnamed protein product, partial [Ectocarpus sp. 8 AP-2014]